MYIKNKNQERQSLTEESRSSVNHSVVESQDSLMNHIVDKWGLQETDLRQAIYFQFIRTTSMIDAHSEQAERESNSSTHSAGCVLLDKSEREKGPLGKRDQPFSLKDSHKLRK